VTYPLKGQYARVTTPYGKRGTAWSCQRDSSGKGVHTGVDLAAPKGTPIYAPCDGQIRHRSYGAAFGQHQFAISPDSGQAFADGEVFFAHTSTRPKDGVYVKMGDQIALVSDEGQAFGAHLHMEYHPSVKNKWNCTVHANPQPVLDHGAEGFSYTEHVYRSKCGYGEPTNGDTSSDTVKELQARLNLLSLVGGQRLTITGNYDDDTDEEVRLWQEQVCDDRPDPRGRSYLGPNQFAVMFPDDTYTLHDDGDPAVASPSSDGLSEIGKRFKLACKYVTAGVKYAPRWDDDVIAGTGPWDPSWLILHHTAGTNSLGWICNGGNYQPTRLANFLVDKDGTLHVCAARKAYHAGKGQWSNVPDNQMNDVSAGVEVESLGQTKDFTDAQILTVSQLATGWMEEFGTNDQEIINHADWSTTGKTDTLYPMTWWRQQFASWNAPPVITPEPPPIIKPPEPPVVTPPDPPKTITFPLGIEYHYSGKPSGNLTFSGSKKKMDVSAWAPKKDGITFGMLYANVDGAGEIRTSVVRDPDDASAFQTHYIQGGDNYLLTHVWFESGEAKRKLWYQFESMDGTTHTVTTRYVKFFTIPWDVTIIIDKVVKVYDSLSKQFARFTGKSSKEENPQAA
jgi:N-acetylmuramoyl-L-alanine amidase/Peptidase family M23